MGSEPQISPSFFISRIPTTLKNSPLFPVGEGVAVKVMLNNFPIGIDVIKGSCPSNKGIIALRGNCPTGVMFLQWVFFLVVSNQSSRCPSG